jgi:hypothetical protein
MLSTARRFLSFDVSVFVANASIIQYKRFDSIMPHRHSPVQHGDVRGAGRAQALDVRFRGRYTLTIEMSATNIYHSVGPCHRPAIKPNRSDHTAGVAAD